MLEKPEALQINNVENENLIKRKNDEIEKLPEVDDEDNETDNLPDIDDEGDEIDDLPDIDEMNDDSAEKKRDAEVPDDVTETNQKSTENYIPENLPPNSEPEIDGKKYYTDDNGKVYRINDKLLPNTEYNVKKYHYKTDDQGRIITASGILQKKDHDGRSQIKDSMDVIGKGDQKDKDDRGHLFADRFNGGNGLENIVPMDSELNQHGDYRKLEDYLVEAVNNGDDVVGEIQVVYEDDSNRPSEFRITVTINGEKEIYVFKNESES